MALTRLCLDTSAYSRWARSDPEALERIDAAAWIGVPSVMLGELYTGFLGGRHGAQNEAVLEEFMAHPRVEELPVDRTVARIYGEIALALRRKGTAVPSNDIWIAATAARAGATLLAADRHFLAIERVGVVLVE